MKCDVQFMDMWMRTVNAFNNFYAFIILVPWEINIWEQEKVFSVFSLSTTRDHLRKSMHLDSRYAYKLRTHKMLWRYCCGKQGWHSGESTRVPLMWQGLIPSWCLMCIPISQSINWSIDRSINQIYLSIDQSIKSIFINFVLTFAKKITMCNKNMKSKN